MVKAGFASMVRGGLIMDVINPEQARIAEEAGVSKHYNVVSTYIYIYPQYIKNC